MVDLEVRRNGSIESEPFREGAQSTTEENWVVQAGGRRKSLRQSCCRQSTRLTHTFRSAHSMTRPPENFPAPTKAGRPLTHSSNAPLPVIGTLAAWFINPISPRQRKGQGSAHRASCELRAGRLSPQAPHTIHSGPAAAALELLPNGQGSVCFKSQAQQLDPLSKYAQANDSRYFAIPCTNTLCSIVFSLIVMSTPELAFHAHHGNS